MTYQEGFWPVARRYFVLLICLLVSSLGQSAKMADQSNLRFQEILPRPASGSPEYLTLHNPTASTINLAGWLIADKSKQTKPISLPDYQLAAGQLWTVEAKTIGLSLNNEAEELFLWQPNGQLVDTVNYTRAPLNIAYQREADGWHWANEIISSTATSLSDKSIENLSDSPTIATLSTTTAQTVQGIVTALPYQMSSQYLYITYLDNSAGLKIYCYYKLWPQLILGSLIEATGQIVSTTQEVKLNIKSQQDIKVIATTTPLTAKTITTQNINQLANGQLIIFTGQLSAKNQSTLYLTDDFGELLVQLKTGTGLKNSDFTIGQSYQITGLIINNNGYRLIPRQPGDVLKIDTTTSSAATTTLDFTFNKKPTISPMVWIVGSIIGLALTFLARLMTKTK
ncbi:lamin tail domain-containing protein [Candidatus Falkowbacteria bacterium]|nr:lamin tail domain-containing protein [Candidatus Falkowbacteria bacterium]